MPSGDSATPAVYHAAQRQERLLSLLGLLSLLSLLSHSTQGGPYFSEQPMHLGQEDQVYQVDQVAAVFSLVTERATGIRKRAAGQGNELPIVSFRMQSHHQHAECAAVEDFAVRLPGFQRVMIRSSSADDELADPAGRIGGCSGVLRREPFVVVVVADEDDIGARLVEVPPESVIRPITPVRP